MEEPVNKEVVGGIKHNSIVDAHTFKPISRQRKWQLRRADEGCCTKCGAFVEFETKLVHGEWITRLYKQCPKCREDGRQRSKQIRTYGGNA